MDRLVAVMVELISEIIGMPKDGLDPSQYFRGKDNDNKLSEKLKGRYNLQRHGHAYHIDSINDQATHIAVRIYTSNIIRMNRPNYCNSGVIACTE